MKDFLETCHDETIEYLDKLSPIKNLCTSYKNADALDQMLEVFPNMFWCQDTGVLIRPTPVGTYEECKGDSMLARVIHVFNQARLEWVNSYAPQDKDEANAQVAFRKHIERTSELTYEKTMLNTFKLLAPIDAKELNNDHYLLGTPSGIYDLWEGALLTDKDPITDLPYKLIQVDEEGHERAFVYSDGYAYKVTKHTNADLNHLIFDREVPDEWLEFIREITCHDNDLAKFLQVALGYALFGGNPEAVMFICYGPTSRNGKTVLFNTILHAIGDYGTQVNPQFLCDNRNDANGTNDELANLVGKRLVYMAEPPSDAVLSDTKVKSYTGNDRISTSRKFGPNFVFSPEFTMFMSCNKLPKVKDNAIFLSGRVIIIPFNRHFTREERDPHLESYFIHKEEIQKGVLEWLTDGYYMYKKEGLVIPESVRKANEKYRENEQDTLDRFIYEYGEFDTNSRWETVDFMNTYKVYCESIEKMPHSTNTVTKMLAERNVTKKKSHGKRYYVGISQKEIFIDWDGFEDEFREREKKAKTAQNSLPHPAPKNGKSSPKKRNDDGGSEIIKNGKIKLP